ncbi:hypothetical protein AQ616_18255 [Oceanobacillus sp. E9]|uniref:hypothetical protein n=1 Tax=Oceanobacillus sp. E9 TaxID=1742575 RepID=UPI00084E6316|nr:hypothetical protein [Oceanobacillus sp. E9]OEH52985.1 hypothetical protein AQ616_18255 [Oceanobacillus sp. E9]
MIFHQREDVRKFINEFEYKELYIFIQERLDELTDEGDFENGLEDEVLFDEVAKMASRKYSLSKEDVYLKFHDIEMKVNEFMIANK